MKKSLGQDMKIKNIDYRLTRSSRRSISMSISDSCEIIVKAPYAMSQKDIDSFILRHEGWLKRKMPSAQSRMRRLEGLDEQALLELTDKAKQYIPKRVEHYAAIMGVEPTGVKITRARKRFGSCSAKNSLCFSCLLMQYPPEAIDSVVVHELAHIKHHNHSADFYNFILKFMPDYREREKQLRN